MPTDTGLAPELTRCVAAIESRLEQAVGEFEGPPELRDAVRHALLGGGKRIRPMLAWHAAIACGGRGPESLAAGAAVELVHAFSLVHDDLPAMDDDPLRRGRPTVHVAFGEAMAILAGDAMLAAAFAQLASVPDARLARDLAAELSLATSRMIAGQVLDTVGGAGAPGDARERVVLTHRLKTAALIRASCAMGGLCALGGETDDGRLARLRAFGDAAGLLFQVVDDILDVEATSDHAGKRTGKDEAAGKLTYPGVMGVAAARQEAARLGEEAVASLAGMGPEADGLRALATYLVARSR